MANPQTTTDKIKRMAEALVREWDGNTYSVTRGILALRNDFVEDLIKFAEAVRREK